MSTYKHEMDKIKMSRQGKRRMLALYSQKEEYHMKRFIKPVVAAAACAAILVGYTVSGNLAVHQNRSQTGESQMKAGNHEFTMTVYAEELKENKPVISYRGDELEKSWVICGEENGNVSYSLATDFACAGEDIKTITYQINNGAFQILKPESVKLDIPMKTTGTIDDAMELPIASYPDVASVDESLSQKEQEAGDGVDGYLASEYTLDYADQKPDNVVFNICGEKKIDADKVFNIHSPEKEKAGMDELLGDIVITCTVTFNDGTTATREIVLENKILTPTEVESETVILDKKNHPDIEKEIEEMANEKRVYLFFKMK